jgi:P4 family phage/plasmid primase-like protien
VSISSRVGASETDWFIFRDVLGLASDLLPVVQNPGAVISPRSAIKELGKTPSEYNRNGQVCGFTDWTSRVTSAADIALWEKQPDYGICVQTRAVRALDVDVTDVALADQIYAVIVDKLRGAELPRRVRANSSKFLVPFRMSGEFVKRTITTQAGKIEFLATGQHFVAAGTHKSGARYEWREPPYVIDTRTAAEFEALWSELAQRFETRTRLSTPSLDWVDNARKLQDTWFEPLPDTSKVAEARLIAATWTAEQATDRDKWLPCLFSVADAVNRGLDREIALDIAEEFSGRTTQDNLADRAEIERTMFSAPRDIHNTIYKAASVAQREGYVLPPKRVPPPPPPDETTSAPALEAQHLCTDQANAARLQKHYGNRLIACAGSFYTWDGTRWKLDDSLAQRFACELSKIVGVEADAARVQAEAAQNAIDAAEIAAHLATPRLKPLRDGETGHKAYDQGEIAKALDKWSVKCEMKSTQDAALGLLKKLLAVDPMALDADPWLLNCANGTVDLRTGILREHRAADLITKLAPVAYDIAAQAPRFRTFLSEIFAEDAAVVEFLGRWFGYAATGVTREQKLVFHWGKGSNGKSTLIETIESVLGDYATTAPQGLLTAKNGDERHPAEIADLHGRRLVTASESEEGAKLREAFIKLTTGGDKLKGRRLYGQLFQFSPTHKLQLLTNHKPQIRGSDFAIWRRILLIPYTQTFGTPEQVASGDANRLGDPRLNETLAAELPGVLAWIVEGARQWHTDGGLKPPAVVLAAGADYRTEQDRIGEFVRDCCTLNITAWSLVSMLYRAYQAWCHDAGIYALSRQRFIDEIERCVPGFQREKRHAGHGIIGMALVPVVPPPMPTPVAAVPAPPAPLSPERQVQLRAALEKLGWPDVASMDQVVEKLRECATNPNEMDEMCKPEYARAVEADLPALEYTVIRKPEREDGRWFFRVNEQAPWHEPVFYGRTDRNHDQRVAGARSLVNAMRTAWTENAVPAIPPPPPAGA